MEIYTIMNTPFALGGTSKPIKTEIEEYERVYLGKGYYGILVKNPKKKLFHIALESGAIIGTLSNRQKLIDRTKEDVASGDENIMAQQVEQSINQCKQAVLLSQEEFFSKFKG